MLLVAWRFEWAAASRRDWRRDPSAWAFRRILIIILVIAEWWWWPSRAGFIFLVHSIWWWPLSMVVSLTEEDRPQHGCFIGKIILYRGYLSWLISSVVCCLLIQSEDDVDHLFYELLGMWMMIWENDRIPRLPFGALAEELLEWFLLSAAFVVFSF